MTQQNDLRNHLDTDMGLNEKNNDINLITATVGILGYLIIFVPILSLAVVYTLKISSEYLIPIASALGITGFYVTEKLTCRNRVKEKY